MWWSRPLVLSAALFLLAGCANPFSGQGKDPIANVSRPSPTPSTSPTPSPSPSPTTKLTAAAPKFRVGEVGAVYPTVAFSVAGGLAPYQWTIASGNIPLGLNLGSDDGSISGTPGVAGTFAFTLQVADSGTSTVSVKASIQVRPLLYASYTPACGTTCNVEIGCVTVCGPFGIVGGGVGPYTYKYVSGQLPAGTAVSTKAMALTGTFAAPQCFCQFTEQVTDSYGKTATLSPTFATYPHVSLTAGACVAALRTGNCTVNLPWSGGVPGQSPTVTWGKFVCNPQAPACSPPPTTFSAKVSGGSVVVSALGPAGSSDGSYSLTLTDGDLCGSGVHCSSAPVMVTVQV